VLYPKAPKPANLQYAASLPSPDGWKFGTPCRWRENRDGVLEFSPCPWRRWWIHRSSPAHFRTLDLSPGAKRPHSLHIVADSAAALELKPEDAGALSHLTAETGALFGARHYRGYSFLLTLSEHVAHFGSNTMSQRQSRARAHVDDADLRKGSAALLPHEMVHSWNGKYRRPADSRRPITSADEGRIAVGVRGLTDYLGIVLATRCGLWTNQNFLDNLASTPRCSTARPGRAWRPLADTAVAAQLLYFAARRHAWRRSVIFIAKANLIWLEADVLIRQKNARTPVTRRFLQAVHGGRARIPGRALHPSRMSSGFEPGRRARLARVLFKTRVYDTNPRAPLGGLRAAAGG